MAPSVAVGFALANVHTIYLGYRFINCLDERATEKTVCQGYLFWLKHSIEMDYNMMDYDVLYIELY